MKAKMIATWDMSYDGLILANEILKNGGSVKEAISVAIKDVENNPEFTSVGYGGLPNINGDVQVDAAYMDGDTLKIGALAGAEHIANPIDVAIRLADEKYNNMLVGYGAQKYAALKGFELKHLLTSKAGSEYDAKREQFKGDDLNSYDGHDTVCMIAIDDNKTISVGTSTSGLFMKRDGRVGDSPISGSGYYADSNYGAAAGTGVGEDIMRGCLSYKSVINIENGLNAQDAAEDALRSFSKKMLNKGEKPRAISIICLDHDGNFGVASNCWFSFVIINDNNEVVRFIAEEKDGQTIYNIVEK